jgi:hypothetical protein
MTDNAIAVTLVTANAASLEYMHNADYVRMVAALNKEFGKSYRWMEKESGCNVSFAQWAQIAEGNRKLNPATRKGVRRMIAAIPELCDELPDIPDPVELVAETMIDVDAEMLWVGIRDAEQRAKRVIMLADDTDMVLHVNGTVTAHVVREDVELPDSTQNDVLPRVASVAANREPVYRPVFSTDEKATFEALGGLRRIIDAGVKALQEDGR